MIEVLPELVEEVRLDVESVLKEYLRTEREITERAKDILAGKGENYSQLGKVKAQLAQRMGFGLGDQAIEYIVSQIIEILFISKNVDEVFGADNEITAKIVPILERFMNLDEGLDLEVRKRIKNLQEGTLARDLEYQRTLAELMKSKKL